MNNYDENDIDNHNIWERFRAFNKYIYNYKKDTS